MSAMAVIAALLCLAALLFPFTVAGTNIALAGALILGVVRGAWWLGAVQLWHGQRRFISALLAYLLLVAAGLVWSMDLGWGLHVLCRHWFWLLIPVGVYALAERTWRSRFLVALSVGLGAHLVFCVLQKFGLVSVTTVGSFPADATGHIGHIGFGFVYGVWAAWLLHWGWLQAGWRRYGAWLLAAWAWVMIFLAQGRSGYLVAIALLCVVLWRHCAYGMPKRVVLPAAGLILLVVGLVVFTAGRARIAQTWSGLEVMFTSGAAKASGIDERWGIWVMALHVWQAHPVLGVGTGGFPTAAGNVGPIGRAHIAVHPHNIYLLALARWGPVGVVLLLWLLYEWIRLGWRQDWQQASTPPLIAMTGIALAVHGMSSNAIEEHFSAVLAVVLLAAGLSESRSQRASD